MSLLLLFGAPQTFTGTGAATAAAATGAASGLLTFSGSGAATATAATSEASGSITFSGTGAASATPATSSASGSLVFSATGSATATASTSASAATLTFTAGGAATAQPATASAAGTQTFTGAGDAAASAAIGTGSASETFTGESSSAATGATGSGHGTARMRTIGSLLEFVIGIFRKEPKRPLAITGAGFATAAPAQGAGSGHVTFSAQGGASASRASAFTFGTNRPALPVHGCGYAVARGARQKAKGVLKAPPKPRSNSRPKPPLAREEDEALAVLLCC